MSNRPFVGFLLSLSLFGALLIGLSLMNALGLSMYAPLGLVGVLKLSAACLSNWSVFIGSFALFLSLTTLAFYLSMTDRVNRVESIEEGAKG